MIGLPARRRALLAAAALAAVLAAPHSHAQERAAKAKDGRAAHHHHHEALPAAEPLPGKSLYHLQASLTDQHGNALALSSLRGRPVLVTMFYASCTTICPMLVARLKRIDAALAAETRARTRVLLVSLDPARDSVAALRELAGRHGVDARRWSFTRTSETSVRELAAVLGVRYQRMPDGELGHSPVIAVLDPAGVIAHRAEDGGAAPDEIVQAVERVAAAR